MEDGNQIVISGISGKFPKCKNVEEFRDKLLKGENMIKEDDRYPPGIYGIPKKCGTISGLDKFDATFFGIHPKQANYMDPRQRMLLETVYEAIIDSGYNPKELRGSKTGVYVGMASFTNTEAYRKRDDTDGYTNIGLSLAIAANRISYCFDFKGPSYALDTACSSSLYAFVNAMRDIEAGVTDSAIVSAAHLITHPHDTLEFLRLNMLSPEGACKVFSTERNGYVRAETVITYFLQKKKDSRRIYATVLGASTNSDGHKKEGITFPSSKEQLQLIDDLYKKVNVDPNDISYMEAHGTGTTIGDIIECGALAKHFCQNRKEPLLIGAVKSNMGHSEVASGLCSVTKVLISLETGIIPANLHLENTLDTKLPGISDKKMKVVTKNTKWQKGLAGVNCFGFGGANAHIILKPHTKEKTSNYQRPKHRLVQVSGRTEEAVLNFLNGIEANQDDSDFLALVDEIHKMNVEGHFYRGYIVLGEKPVKEITKCTGKRPIWFIYTGMGSQWNKMGRDLLENRVFRSTIERCAAALKPYNIDLLNVITSDDPQVFEDITNCFCAIGCVEIALTDLLYSLGIKPDGIAGHSLGEVGCAYADGNITPEQAALLAFSRGYGCQNSTIPPGQMAAVGLSKEELIKILPEDIFIACQNSATSFTISGPQEKTKAFVEELSSKGVFARLVKSANIAFHTKYVAEAGNYLLDFCKGVLTDPKPRSKRWVSSSVPPSEEHVKWTQYNCAEYHHNNFCNTVLFDQVFKHIPENAVVIEVAPHGLLQAILKRELNAQHTHISLMNRANEDNEHFFLSSIGKIYLAGGQPQLSNFFHKVSFPVARGTKMLSPLVEWDHSVSWFTAKFENQDFFGQEVTVSLSDDRYSYLQGHEIDGRVLMPATGYLELVWQVIADKHLKKMTEMPIVFQNVKLKRATVLSYGDGVHFIINIMKNSGYFEINESGSVVCCGTICLSKNISTEFTQNEVAEIPKNGSSIMSNEDVYKECHLRRYMYKDLFRGVVECDVNGLNGLIEWKERFTSFMDAMLHLTVVSDTWRDLKLPTQILKLVIDPEKHINLVEKQKVIGVSYNPYLNIITSGGIQITGMEYSKAPRKQHVQAPPILETYDFIHYKTALANQYDFDTALKIVLQIILQNTLGLVKQLKICEINCDNITEKIMNIVAEQFQTQIDFSSTTAEDLGSNKYDVVIINDDMLSSINMSAIKDNLTKNGFLLYKGLYEKIDQDLFQIIFQNNADDDGLHLLRPQLTLPENCSIISIKNIEFDWLDKLKHLIQNEESKLIYLLAQGEETSGIMGLMQCLISEINHIEFKAIFIDKTSKEFTIHDNFFMEQLRKNLTFNVLKQNIWGTYVHLPLKKLLDREVGNATVGITTVGDFSTLTWIERPFEGIRFNEKREMVYVYYSALNFKDIMVSSGKIPSTGLQIPMESDIAMGLEYSGVSVKGKRVMGILPCEGLILQASSDTSFTWEIPKTWSLRDAATVPVVYTTCYYGLIMRGQLQPGESILIHAGSGGIGIAAINIALSMGCQVFTTVSNKEKRDFIKKMFPQINDKNIGNSRNTSFETMIKINTKGKGVDVVLNSLADDLFQASIRCLAERGRYLEIGKVDLINSSSIPSNIFLRNISFHGIYLDRFLNEGSLVKHELHYLLAEGVASGVVKPLPSVVYDETQVESAFRYLASGKHKGKVLIEIRKEELVPITAPIRSIYAIPKVYFDANKSYILIGGLGGFGLELVSWLIQKGATKIILNSRRGITNGYQSYCLKKWSQYKGIVVKIDTNDTSSHKGAESLIKFASELGPVGGIFNMALVLKDGLVINQTKENFDAVFKTKIVSGQNMDALSRVLCKELDHFVVFSSLVAGRGNVGQTNYAMANSALERLCEIRRSQQLPGLAIQWGPIGEVGALVKLGVEDKVFKNAQPQRIMSCLDALETFMLQQCVVGSSMVLVQDSDNKIQNNTRTPVEAVAHILGINNIDLVDKAMTLSNLGLDSLMGTEIKQTLYRNFQIELTPEEIMNLTLNDLIAMNMSESKTDISENQNAEIQPLVTETPLSYLIPEDVVIKLNAIKNAKNIFMLHPIEGNVDILKPIAKKINANVYGLQSSLKITTDKMDQIAKYYIQIIKQIQPQGPYFLCGYSYGASLGIEISQQLEENEEIVDLISIDGSPILVQNILKNRHLRLDQSIEKSQIALLETFSSSFPQVDITQISKVLANYKEWEHQLGLVSEIISKTTGLDRIKIEDAANGFFQRVAASYYYEPKSMLKGRILLIRRDDNPFFLSDNYELQKLCKQEVQVVKLRGNHTSILLGDNIEKVANFINRFFKV